MESFEHFEEDQRSWEHLSRLPPELVAEAVSIWGVKPNAGIAGLMIESGTQLHPDIARHFQDQIPTAKEGICAIVPIDFARHVVARHGGTAAVETVRGMGEPETGSMLVVVLTPNGLRCGIVRIWEPYPADPTLGGPDFGVFTVPTLWNEDLKLLREAVERAKQNPVRPGEFFNRRVAKKSRPDGSIYERIRLYCVDLSAGTIIIIESSAGMMYARRTTKVDSIG